MKEIVKTNCSLCINGYFLPNNIGGLDILYCWIHIGKSNMVESFTSRLFFISTLNITRINNRRVQGQFSTLMDMPKRPIIKIFLDKILYCKWRVIIMFCSGTFISMEDTDMVICSLFFLILIYFSLKNMSCSITKTIKV